MPINDTRHPVLGEGPHEERSDLGTGILGCVVNSVLNVFIGDNALHLSLLLECVVEPAFCMDVMIF